MFHDDDMWQWWHLSFQENIMCYKSCFPERSWTCVCWWEVVNEFLLLLCMQVQILLPLTVFVYDFLHFLLSTSLSHPTIGRVICLLGVSHNTCVLLRRVWLLLIDIFQLNSWIFYLYMYIVLTIYFVFLCYIQLAI